MARPQDQEGLDDDSTIDGSLARGRLGRRRAKIIRPPEDAPARVFGDHPVGLRHRWHLWSTCRTPRPTTHRLGAHLASPNTLWWHLDLSAGDGFAWPRRLESDARRCKGFVSSRFHSCFYFR